MSACFECGYVQLGRDQDVAESLARHIRELIIESCRFFSIRDENEAAGRIEQDERDRLGDSMLRTEASTGGHRKRG
jgi:hypothetical protein